MHFLTCLAALSSITELNLRPPDGGAKGHPRFGVWILYEGGWMAPCSLAISISSTGVYDCTAALPGSHHPGSWPFCLQRHTTTTRRPEVCGWNSPRELRALYVKPGSALLPHHTEYLLCGLRNNCSSTWVSFFTCTDKRNNDDRSLGTRQQCRLTYQSDLYSAGTEEHQDPGPSH